MSNSSFTKLCRYYRNWLPDALEGQIEPLFINGIQDDWSDGNVEYWFPNGPLEHEKIKGFYYIPGFSKFLLSKEGELYSLDFKSIVRFSRMPGNKKINSTGGYHVRKIRMDNGLAKHALRHRVLLATFRHPGKPIAKLVVNHINGIPGDDRLENIEFCTHSENIKHAWRNNLYQGRRKPVDCLNWITGASMTVESVAIASEHTGIEHSVITARMARGNASKYRDGWRFKTPDDVWLPLKETYGASCVDVAVLAMNVNTGEVLRFPSINEAARSTNTAFGLVQSQVANRPFRPCRGWSFRRADDELGFPEYSERQLAIFKDNPMRPGAGVVAKNLKTGEELFFTSDKKAGEFFNLSWITVSKLARYNQIWNREYQFSLVRLE